jgi:hypothetical protein
MVWIVTTDRIIRKRASDNQTCASNMRGGLIPHALISVAVNFQSSFLLVMKSDPQLPSSRHQDFPPSRQSDNPDLK